MIYEVRTGTGDIARFSSPDIAEAYAKAVRRGARLDRLAWASIILVLAAAAILAYAHVTGWRL